MSDPENFLARWARRKREATQESAGAPAAPADGNVSDAPAPAGMMPNETSQSPAFDLDSLPSIDSITADTDIRGFFAPGVPAELTRAALRRAWTADPKIRDFVGLAENAWDFNNPEAIHGFGTLEMTAELRRAAERIVGQILPADEDAEAIASAPPESTQPSGNVQEIESAPEAPAEDRHAVTESRPDVEQRPPDDLPADETITHRDDNNAAAQRDSGLRETQSPARRVHGRALPQ